MILIDKIKIKQLLFGLESLFVVLRNYPKTQNNIELIKVFMNEIINNNFKNIKNIKLKISHINKINLKKYIIDNLSKIYLNNKKINLTYVVKSFPLIISILNELKMYYDQMKYDKIYYLSDSIHNLPRLLMNLAYFNDESLGNVNIINYLKDNKDSIIKKEWDEYYNFIINTPNVT